MGTFGKSKISLAEKSANGALVTPIPGLCDIMFLQNNLSIKTFTVVSLNQWWGMNDVYELFYWVFSGIVLDRKNWS